MTAELQRRVALTPALSQREREKSELPSRVARAGLLVALLLLLPVAATRGEDRVILERKGFLGRLAVTGVIDEYTGRKIIVRSLQGDAVREFPADEVVEIETPYTEPHTRALELLSAGRTEEAFLELEAALKKESREWVRREIVALQVRSALRRADYVSAGTRFLLLLKSDPETPHFGLIPLVWAPETLTPQAKVEAQRWLVGPIDAGRLMGASYLVDDPAHATQAHIALRALASSADERVAQLAQMQAWRKELATEVPAAQQLARWQKRIEELPVNLRAGPMYLLGRGFAARHDFESAAAAYLWLPITDDHDYRLSARACLDGALALDRIGQRIEAQTLLRELVRRFADTPFADEAQVHLRTFARESQEEAESPRGR